MLSSKSCSGSRPPPASKPHFPPFLIFPNSSDIAAWDNKLRRNDVETTHCKPTQHLSTCSWHQRPLFLNCVVFSANQERVSELPIFLTLKWKFCSSRSFTSYEESNKCWFFLWRIRRIKLEFSDSESIKILIRIKNSFELYWKKKKILIEQKNWIDNICGREGLLKGGKKGSKQMPSKECNKF